MIYGFVALAAAAAGLLLMVPADSHSQGGGVATYDRDFGDVKFLDAYFGTPESKIEVDGGDKNVPFTAVFANVGTQDITGIRGQLSLPFGFSPSDGPGSIIRADSNSHSLAGENFYLTFFVNLDGSTKAGQYPGSVMVEYSRLRESGVRSVFEDFDFKVTGDSVINVRASEPFLTSLETNNAVIEVINDGTAPISGVDIIAANTQTELASTSSSITNVENVVILESNWDIGTLEPQSSKFLTATVYVPESLKGDTLRIPLLITYYNAHGDRVQLSKIVDFYVRGLIDLTVFNVGVVELSENQMVVGEILNEGNQDGLFGFVSLEPKAGSNIMPQTQFIDEIEVDAPVPFNLPLEFDGQPTYGEHDITIKVRYKDGIREELFVNHDATVRIAEPVLEESGTPDITMVLLPLLLVAGVAAYLVRRKKRRPVPV